jgi:hypothetical protein
VIRKLETAIAGAVLIGCAACSSSGGSTAHLPAGTARPGATGRSVTAGAPTNPATGRTAAEASSGSETSSRSGGGSTFCSLVHKVGLDNLGLTEAAGNSLDAKKLLAGIDALDTAAPADIKHDFDVYDKFEHVLLDPGTASDPADLSSSGPPIALEHVAEYLADNCSIGG